MVFEGANDVNPVGRDELGFASNFLLGNDPSGWKENVPSFREVAYLGLYDGIDMVFRSGPHGVKYDLYVHPGGVLNTVVLTFEGAGSPLPTESGGLAVRTAAGDLIDAAPVATQDGVETACGFTVRGTYSVGFECPWRDPTKTLVIDPLLYSTWLGGGAMEIAYGVATDAAGSAYVTGKTLSVGFPVTPGAFDTVQNGNDDAFVTKLSPDGSSLVYSTFIGGPSTDVGNGVYVDIDGNAYVVGYTTSNAFPTTPGSFDPVWNGGGQDGFALKLNATGSGLFYSTFLGGAAGVDAAYSVGADLAGNAFVMGSTAAGDFPTTPGAFDTLYGGGRSDLFVTKLNATGSGLLYSTFVGGFTSDVAYPNSVGVDLDGNAYVTGETTSTNFPTTPGAFDESFNGATDAFVTKLNATGSGLLYSTYLGGASWTDLGMSIAVDASGNAYVGGITGSGDFPVTPGVFQPTKKGFWDAYVTKLNATGSGLVFSTFLGGNTVGGEDCIRALRLDASGNIVVTGFTNSGNFPTTVGSFDPSLNGLYDVFVAKMNSTGTGLVYSTYLGGASDEDAWSLAVDGPTDVYVAGYSGSAAYPVTVGAFDSDWDFNADAFVTKLRLVGGTDSLPLLSWTGEPGYIADGVDPDRGSLDTTFTYRVKYSDSDSDPPTRMWVAIEKPLGTFWGTFPMEFSSWLGSPGDYVPGALYTYQTKLSPEGDNFTYSFNSSDGRSWASGAPALWTDGPDVFLDAPPTAVATPSKATASIGEAIMFDASNSTDDFGVVAFLWDFGDGATDGAITTTHAYSARGAYAVTLTVWDTLSQTGTDRLGIGIENRPPVAFAGSDFAGAKNTVVTLDGTGSSDPDADGLNFSWTQVAGPGVALSAPDTATPSFVPGAAGDYAFEVTVNDGWGGESNDSVTVSVVNRGPVANAGTDKTAPKKSVVGLDGSGSYDPDGEALTFLWVQTGGPVVSLVGPDSDQPTFTPSASGIHEFQLTVNDGDGGIASDTVRVTVTNAPPVADAGSDQVVSKKSTVTLNASRSSDSDGDSLTFLWVQLSGASVTLTDGTTATPTFIPPISGVYVFEVSVNDGDGGTSSDTVQVTATNAPPVANAGPDRMAQKGTVVPLDGAMSTDPNGDTLSFLWTHVEGPSVVVSGPTDATASFVPTVAGSYRFQLRVDDGDGGAATDEVRIDVWGLGPRANLTVTPAGAAVGRAVTFDGSGSSDPDGTIVRYDFSFGDGSTAAGTASVETHSYAVAGTYVASLIVTDEDGNSSTAQATVTVVPNAVPTAQVSVWPGTVGTLATAFVLDGANSSDPDGSIASWRWAFGDGGTAIGPRVVHTHSSKGEFTVALTVTDDAGATDQVSVAVTVLNRPPEITSTFPATPEVVFAAGGARRLSVTASDPDGDPLAFAWRIDGTQAGSTGEFLDLPMSFTGNHVVNVTVSDGLLQDSYEWTVRTEAGSDSWNSLLLGGFLLVIAVSFAVIALAVYRRRRKNGGPGEAPTRIPPERPSQHSENGKR